MLIDVICVTMDESCRVVTAESVTAQLRVRRSAIKHVVAGEHGVDAPTACKRTVSGSNPLTGSTFITAIMPYPPVTTRLLVALVVVAIRAAPPRLVTAADRSLLHVGCTPGAVSSRLDLPLRRSFRVLRPTAARVISAGFLVVLVPLDVRGFHPDRARAGHAARPQCELPR
jgi:hypothetical protein